MRTSFIILVSLISMVFAGPVQDRMKGMAASRSLLSRQAVGEELAVEIEPTEPREDEVENNPNEADTSQMKNVFEQLWKMRTSGQAEEIENQPDEDVVEDGEPNYDGNSDDDPPVA